MRRGKKYCVEREVTHHVTRATAGVKYFPPSETRPGFVLFCLLGPFFLPPELRGYKSNALKPPSRGSTCNIAVQKKRSAFLTRLLAYH